MLVFYRLTPAEIAFLREYAKTMKPVAKAVNILQGEAKVQMADGMAFTYNNTAQGACHSPFSTLYMQCFLFTV